MIGPHICLNLPAATLAEITVEKQVAHGILSVRLRRKAGRPCTWMSGRLTEPVISAHRCMLP